ncbi:MAG TPA: hypothetical protein ENK23_09175 [Sorangium sp.]|nr:hypothetical protein [Sorangium sp.]
MRALNITSQTGSIILTSARRWLLPGGIAVLLTAAGFVGCGDGDATSTGASNAAAGGGAAGGTSGAGGDNTGGGAATGGQGGDEGQFGGNFGGTGDEDGDGISDSDEGKDAPNGPTDTDGDGTPDYQDTDSDDDGLSDKVEGLEDDDGDSIPNFQDPFNDGPPPTIKLTAITTPFTTPIGIDYHEPTNSLVLSANYPNGMPFNFERIEQDGTHHAFSMQSGFTDEVKIATARPGNASGFASGELFVGNGIDGQIVRISADGMTITNPWVDLPGVGNGLMRGSFVVDHKGVLFGGDLIAVTTVGQVWRITAAGVPTMIADVPGVHLEGVAIVPNAPTRFGPLAGKIIAGAETVGLLYAFAADGTTESYAVGVNIEDIDIVLPNENFFGVNYGSSNLYGAEAAQFASMHGDILLTQEGHTGSGLFRLQWDGQALVAAELAITADSAVPLQWEHVTFAAAGVKEIPNVPTPQ